VNVYPFIEAEKRCRRNVTRACELLKVSRATFYAHLAGRSLETTVVIGTLSASGAFCNRCAPGGTTNALRMAAASATARSRGLGDAAVTGPVVVFAAAQPATANPAQAAMRSVMPGAHRTCGRTPLGRPPGHRGSALRQ
jgi:hypothetical protein